jgi:hypothetical protein
MATIPYLYSKGEGQGFRVLAANKNAGINVDRFFRANQKQEAINFAKQIAKKIEKETKGFINRRQLGEKLGVNASTIEKYKGSNNEIYKKIKELFEVKKIGQTSEELYKPKISTAIGEIKKLVDIGNVKPKLTYRGKQTSMSLIKNALNESETPLNIKQLKEKFPKIPFATIQTSLAELKFNKNFKDKISLISPKEVADVGAQTKAIKRTPMMNVLRNVFVLDPDADSTDIAKAIYGDKNFNNADNIKKLEYLKDAARQVPKFVAQFSKGASTVTPNFKSIRSDKLGDILDSIENRISDFGFEPGIRRDLQLSIADAKRGLPEGATRMARNRLLQRGMAVDEVGAVAATFDRAPGYLEATQVIDFLKNKDKGKKLDLKFSRALGKALDGDFSDIKDYNQLAKDFGKKYKIDVPIFLTGKNLKPEEQIKYFDEFSEGAQKNIKEIAKQNNFVIKTKSKPLFSLAGIPFQGKGKYAFLGLAAPFIANATPYQGKDQQSQIQDTQTAMQDQTIENQPIVPQQQITPITEVADASSAAKLADDLVYDDFRKVFVKRNEPEVKANQSDLLYWLADNVITESPIASIGVGTAGLSIPGAKETFEAARKADKGILKSSLGVLGKGLTRVGSPAGTALFEIPFIAEQIQEGKSPYEILSDPLNYIGPAFTETLTRGAGAIKGPPKGILGGVKDTLTFEGVRNPRKAAPGLLNLALRLGLSPRNIALISGTGAIGAIGATALTAFDLANAYRKGELDNLFSSEEGDTSGGVFLPGKLDTTGIMGLKNET